MKQASEILKTYWGFDTFRPQQEEIIEAVLAQKDVLALLPTGGGKSICFQVPAMMSDGICIVISPLIALMKDQVANLERRGIKALTVTSELDHRQIDALFDRCIYDEEIKFLYMSPERLKTDLAKARIPQMNVNLVAVDEAHCISEWGYDFRPSYLEIAAIRELIPVTPIIALTASATRMVVSDIQEKLNFKSGHEFFRKSFDRPNLSYFVDWTADKFGKTEKIARKQKGSGIIYMRSRKGTERIAKELEARGLSVAYYHAGLDANERSERQAKWMKGDVQIIAATNAFGMGIDKPDVRFVIHFDIPDTLENYYQECGRAGRDEQKAFACALLNEADIERFKDKGTDAFPEPAEIKRVYSALCNYLSLAVGSAKDETYQIDFRELCRTFNLDAKKATYSLQFLSKEGYINWSQTPDLNSRLKLIAEYQLVYDYRVKGDTYSDLIDVLLRSHSRLFDEFSIINEWTLAKRLRWSKKKVETGLRWLNLHGMASYVPAKGDSKVTFLSERLDEKNLRFSKEHYKLRKHIVQKKADAMIEYITSTHKCRNRMILEYFDESNVSNCGRCDYCVS